MFGAVRLCEAEHIESESDDGVWPVKKARSRNIYKSNPCLFLPLKEEIL